MLNRRFKSETIMINIRAGLLYNLCSNDVKDIKSHIMQDILYINKELKRLIEYSYYIFIRNSYVPGQITIMDDLPGFTDVFSECTDEIANRFFADGFDEYEILTMMKQFIDVRDVCAANNLFIVDNWTYGTNKQGILFERVALDNLRKIGFVIRDSEHASKQIEYNGDTILLNGKPDGVIVSSPGDVFSTGTAVEIKYKINKSKFRLRDEMQLCAYGLIFNTDVLYVVINSNNSMECTLYKHSRLLQIWESKKDIIINNTLKIANLIKNYTTDDDALMELISLAK
jgi:hypothetical protein